MKEIIIIFTLIFMYQDSSSLIFDFKKEEDFSSWYIVDDGVMGGLSKGSINPTDSGSALYSGTVRTENNGGFSSMRYQLKAIDVSKFSTINLKVKGDGKAYQFRIKADRTKRYSYVNAFQTSGEWEIISLSLASFYPSFRGNPLDQPNYAGDVMEEIAILIGSKKRASFSLQIEKIYLEK